MQVVPPLPLRCSEVDHLEREVSSVSQVFDHLKKKEDILDVLTILSMTIELRRYRRSIADPSVTGRQNLQERMSHHSPRAYAAGPLLFFLFTDGLESYCDGLSDILPFLKSIFRLRISVCL